MIAFMKHFVFALLLPCLAVADEPSLDLSEALRKGLFAEEATRDLKTAAEHYQAIIDAYGKQRQYAGTALYRLAEIKRKQGDKDAAAKLYQRIVVEFPDDETLAKLSRENLTALGMEIADAPNAPAVVDEEAKEISRLTALFESSPDLLSNWVGKEQPPLHAAVTKNQRKVLEFLVKRGVKIDLEFSGSTALEVACAKGNMALATYLIEHKADIHGREGTSTPFGKAYESQMVQVARMLIEKGADPNRAYMSTNFGNTQTMGGYPIVTPLTHAVNRGDAEMVDLLIKKGADVNKARPQNQGNRMIRPGLPVPSSGQGQELRTPIAIAAGRGNAALVKTLLAAGAKVNVEKDVYPVPLHDAISSGSEACVKLLIEAKADVNTRIGQYESPLSLAAMAGSKVLVKLLLDAGAKPGTPWVLMTALAQQQSPMPEFLRFLVEHGIRNIEGINWDQLEPETEAALHELRYPEWFAAPQITLFPRGVACFSKDKDTDTPPELWSIVNISGIYAELDASTCVIVRRSEDGKGIERLPFDLAAWSEKPDREKLPKLKWGDVLEFKFAESGTANGQAQGPQYRRRTLIPPQHPAPVLSPTSPSPFNSEVTERLRKAGTAK